MIGLTRLKKPPDDLVAQLFVPSSASVLNIPRTDKGSSARNFLRRFADSALFFLHPRILSSPPAHSSHNPGQPSISLLSVVCLWGCVLSPEATADGYTEDTFHRSALRKLPADIAAVSLHPRLLLQAIQAEVLLSYYYLHTARTVEGRCHYAAATSLALGAGLNALGSSVQQRPEVYPLFPLADPHVLPPAENPEEEDQRVKAFWAVWILNNYWVAAQGYPSSIPSAIPIDTPWPSSARVSSSTEISVKFWLIHRR